MELFYDNGHLSAEGLAALADGSLDELSRLEAAEHLSFCDECLSRQLAMLEAVREDELLSPCDGFARRVAARTLHRGKRVFFSRAAPAVAAVCLVAAMWVAGFFVSAESALPGVQESPAAAAAKPLSGEETLGEKINEKAMEISTAFNDFFFSLRVPAAPKAG